MNFFPCCKIFTETHRRFSRAAKSSLWLIGNPEAKQRSLTSIKV